MNTKQLITSSLLASVLAAAGSAAMASEATEFSIPPSTLTRAEVRAELMRAIAGGELVSSAQAEQRPFAVAASARAREPVWTVARRNDFNDLYVGG